MLLPVTIATGTSFEEEDDDGARTNLSSGHISLGGVTSRRRKGTNGFRNRRVK